MTSPSPSWSENSEEHALDCLKRAVFFLGEVSNELSAWKWAIVALYGALYGFAIAACAGSNYDRVLRKHGERTILISFGEAIERCQRIDNPKAPTKKKLGLPLLATTKPMQLSKEQKRLISILQKRRNDFAHFCPMVLRVDAAEFHCAAEAVLEAVDFLVFESGVCMSFIWDAKRRWEVKAAIVKGKKILREIREISGDQKFPTPPAHRPA